MARGLVWLSLLIVITVLFWVGWREYRKVEGYRIWSQQFDKAKYDIYAVMGLKDSKITWGKPTPKGIAGLETFSLKDVKKIELKLGDSVIDTNNISSEKSKDTPQLTFNLIEENKVIKIPFTELELAAQWQQFLSSQDIIKS